MRTFLVALALLAGASLAHAQDVDHRPGVWGGAFFNDTLDGALPKGMGPHLWFDLHLRQRPPGTDDGAGSFLTIIRPGVGFAFAPWLKVDVGYAWVGAFSAYGPSAASEHRAWSHVLLGGTVGPLKLSFRPRFELRFDSARPQVGVRVRTFGRMNVNVSKPVYIPLWIEAFWQTNTYGALGPGLEENRGFVGVGFKPAPWMAAELGYMNRWIPATTNPAGAQMQHTALVVLSFSPDLTLKPKGAQAAEG